ncbi:glycine betaine ABC transporter substrate-binding protein [Calidifontibacillus oryziterrae]|uniref:glycine betaine ABC transporter substrate-binding protein n=1 Tax=Calidifontibacillus oryziterrae TaxID=1191699 RepID=UPI0002FE3AB4|nr:glycine betaine ABC transporter substrate-binding protein [Calidifontibacillus oryziterrae]
MKKWLSFLLVFVLAIGLAACGSQETSNEEPATETEPATTETTGSEAATPIGESVDYQIVGIDPGAGIMKATASAIEEYELEDWEVIEGSGAAMTAALKKAYDKEEPIIVTGWTPHWKFAKFDLKYLEDPKGVYGEDENIHTITRAGLKEDHPNAYIVLDQFHWTADDMSDVMVMIEDGMKEEEAAAKWVEENADRVAEWTAGAEQVESDEITLAYVAWASEIASTNVLAKVLTDVGYDVTMTQLEAGPLWAGIADGSADASVAAWLPVTHADYYAEFEGQFEDLGSNMEGTRIGLVVPSYMDINSIEDLK